MSYSPIVIFSDSGSSSSSDSDDSVVFVGSKKPRTGGASVVDTSTYRSTPFVPHVSALEGLFAQAKSNSILGGKVRAIMQSKVVATPARLALPPASPPLPGSSSRSILSASSSDSSSSIASSRSSDSSSSTSTSFSRRFPRKTIRFHVQDKGTPYSDDLTEADLTDENDAVLYIDNNYLKTELDANLDLLFPGIDVWVKVYPPTSNPKLYEPAKHFIFVTVFKDGTDVNVIRDIPVRLQNLKGEKIFERAINVFYDQDADSSLEKTSATPEVSAIPVPEPAPPAAVPEAQSIEYTVDSNSEVKREPYREKPTDAVELNNFFQNLGIFRGKKILVKQDKKCFVDIGKKSDRGFRTDPAIQIDKPFNITVVPELLRYLSSQYGLRKVYADPNAEFKGNPHFNMCLYHALSIALRASGDRKTPSDMKEAALAQLEIQLGQLRDNLRPQKVTLTAIITRDYNWPETYVRDYPLVQGMFDSGIDDAQQYIRYIGQSGTMGGEPEILCISNFLGPNYVIVEYMKQSYDKCQSDKEFDNLHRWVIYFSDGKRLDNYVEQKGKVYLRMLYTGGHYDALLKN